MLWCDVCADRLSEHQGRCFLSFFYVIVIQRVETNRETKNRSVFMLVTKEIGLGISWILYGILWMDSDWSIQTRI
jgi:uncharacterized protein with PQ loop repeat